MGIPRLPYGATCLIGSSAVLCLLLVCTYLWQNSPLPCSLCPVTMKRTIVEIDSFESRAHGRSSPSLIDRFPSAVGAKLDRRDTLQLEGKGEDADRLRALRSLRRKRSKPEDWMSGTFHQYDISDVVGAGTFGQVCGGLGCYCVLR